MFLLLYIYIKKGMGSDVLQQRDEMLTAGNVWVQKREILKFPQTSCLSFIWLSNQINMKYFKVNTYFYEQKKGRHFCLPLNYNL